MTTSGRPATALTGSRLPERFDIHPIARPAACRASKADQAPLVKGREPAHLTPSEPRPEGLCLGIVGSHERAGGPDRLGERSPGKNGEPRRFAGAERHPTTPHKGHGTGHTCRPAISTAPSLTQKKPVSPSANSSTSSAPASRARSTSRTPNGGSSGEDRPPDAPRKHPAGDAVPGQHRHVGCGKMQGLRHHFARGVGWIDPDLEARADRPVRARFPHA